tara:strand:- start:341 stop:952 length:612 start_codon:yes stop_codon:yes gene_type:complete
MFNWFKKKKKTRGFTSTKDLDPDNPGVDFLQQEMMRIMDEADEKRTPNELQKEMRRRMESNQFKKNLDKKTSKKDSDPTDLFINHLQKSLKIALGKHLGKKLNVKDKYLLGYIYGLCDYTNDLHGLDNEIQGIGTFLKMHIFFFGDKDPGDLGGIMGETGKLSASGDETFLEGAIDGGRALGNEKMYDEPPKKAYSKLVSHLS